jgi:hypothetical protein
MKLWKCAAMIATGGLLLQVGGCAAILVETVANQVVTQLIVTILSALLGTQTQA